MIIKDSRYLGDGLSISTILGRQLSEMKRRYSEWTQYVVAATGTERAIVATIKFTSNSLKPINVEITMGHNIGLSASYYKTIEREVSDDYLKAVDVLTINSDKIILQKQVAKLSEKSKNNEYIIRGKLVEKDYQIKNLSEKFNSMQSMLEKVITATTQVQNPRQFSSIAQTLFTSGVLKVEEKIKEG
jgi:hypothetical protein